MFLHEVLSVLSLLTVIHSAGGFSTIPCVTSPVISHAKSNRLSSRIYTASEQTEYGEFAEVFDEDDEDEKVIPYCERSLGWTKRYRRLVPYEHARRTAMRLGLRSKEEWDDIREFGKAFHGAHLVSQPDLMYAKEWISWEEFLGVMRPYDEARDLVQNQLKLTCMADYIAYVKEDTKRAEDLRIPAKPEIVYREKGWTTEEDFFEPQSANAIDH